MSEFINLVQTVLTPDNLKFLGEGLNFQLNSQLLLYLEVWL